MSIDAIRRYIQAEILNDLASRIDADEDLLLAGTLDSMRVMRLVQHLEDETGIAVPPEDVTLENFSSLRRIDAYLARRREGRQLGSVLSLAEAGQPREQAAGDLGERDVEAEGTLAEPETRERDQSHRA